MGRRVSIPQDSSAPCLCLNANMRTKLLRQQVCLILKLANNTDSFSQKLKDNLHTHQHSYIRKILTQKKKTRMEKKKKGKNEKNLPVYINFMQGRENSMCGNSVLEWKTRKHWNTSLYLFTYFKLLMVSPDQHHTEVIRPSPSPMIFWSGSRIPSPHLY